MRRSLVFLLLVGCSLVAASITSAASPVVLESPSGRVRGEFFVGDNGQLSYRASLDGKVVIDTSPIGLVVDGADLSVVDAFGPAKFAQVNETYPVRGGKSQARNHARTLTLPVTPREGREKLALEARAFDDGLAFRLLLAGNERRRVNHELTGWTLPADSQVWLAERHSDWKLKTYAGEWIRVTVDELPRVSKQGPVQGPPLVAELPSGGYALLTEAALASYSGMRLQALGERKLQVNFTEGKAGFEVNGPITTPWRVTILARTLDELVNSDVITNLNPPPDDTLFADTSYIKPGRCVWRWWSVGTGTPEEERQFIDYAAELGFEFSMIDDGWAAWENGWERLRELADYARRRRVELVIWSDVKDLRSPADEWRQLRTFLDRAQAAGIAAVKLDFINSESRESIDFEHAALRLAAQRRLMVVFHGVQKPTGEPRTYPNEITREGIRGLELNKIMTETVIPASHNAALPYTRLVIGHGDYTPLGYSRPGETTWAHQLATVVQFISPLQVIAEHPEKLLRDPATRPALDLLKAIPATWDETRVLAPSKIGELSIIARRTGKTWFLSVLTGDKPVELTALDLSFLGSGEYRLTAITSPHPTALHREGKADVNASTPLPVRLSKADGWVGCFEPQ